MATIALRFLSYEFMNDKNDNTALMDVLENELNIYGIDECAINTQKEMALVSFYRYNHMKEALEKIKQNDTYFHFKEGVIALTTGHSDQYYFDDLYS